MKTLDTNEVNQVSGGDACTNAFELSYGAIGGSLGLIFGPAGGVAGFKGIRASITT